MTEPKPDSCDDAFHRSPLFQVFRTCATELRSFLTRRLGCPDLAADLVQDTYIRLATRPDADVHDNPRALVFRIAANLATDHSRKQRLRDAYDGGNLDEVVVSSPEPAPDAELAAQQEHALLKEAIEQKNFSITINPALSPGKYFLRFAINHQSYSPTHNSEKIELIID